jgi:hypothetical protein
VEERGEKVGIGLKCVNLKMVEMQILLEKEKIGHIFIEVNVTMKYPSKQQLYYEISKLKREKFGVVTISIKELNEWILKNSAIPEDDDEPFVLKHETGTNLLFGGIHCTLNNDDENL